MSKVFVVDIKYCNGCRNCQIACKDEHCGQPWLPIADAQPMTGHFWCKVDEEVRGQVPLVKMTYTPIMCGHCDNAPCMAAGGDAVYKREDGLVIIDPAKAKGMKNLVDACPQGSIFYNEELDLPQKCTGCAHLLDNGWDVPRCVDACPTDALRYVEESEVDLSNAVVAKELSGFGPKVYYINVPKRFVGGAVVDKADDELIIGMEVFLRTADGELVATTKTDEFGDFLFDGLEAGKYKVSLPGQEIEADLTERDLSLGDIFM